LQSPQNPGRRYSAIEQAGMFARVVSFQHPPERLDGVPRRLQDAVPPVMRQQAGFQNAYVLVDRASGKQLGISFWDTDEHAKAALASLDAIRTQSAQELGDRAPPTTEHFEVVVRA
jgi:hypothetical protein